MGVDNFAVLFLGEYIDRVNLEVLVDKDKLKNDYLDDIKNYFYYESPRGMIIQRNNDCSCSDTFVGFSIIATEPYDYEKANTKRTVTQIQEKSKIFYSVFGVAPSLILIACQD